MTFLVRYTNPALTDPSPRYFDLDDPREWEEFELLVTSCTDSIAAMHLYEGQSITIECLRRDDSKVSQHRRDAFA